MKLRFSAWGIGIGSSLALFVGCSSSGGSSGFAGDGGNIHKTPGQELCESIASYVNQCGAATPCDQALVADCAKVVDLLSAEFLSATKDCMKAGGSPASCLSSSLGGLTPTAAQQKFATTFCSECTGGLVPGCEQVFFAEGDTVPEKLKVAGKVILPFSDTLVSALETDCATASPLTCVANFSTCAQQTLAKQAIPTESAQCILNTLISGGGSAPSGGCGDSGTGGTAGTGSGGTGGASGSGGSGATGGTGGAGGSGGGIDGGTCGSALYMQACTAIGFGDPACDGCADTSCCSVIEQCLDDVDCAGLVECMSTFCNDAADPNACAAQNCGSCATSSGVTLFNGIGQCLQTSCATECQ